MRCESSRKENEMKTRKGNKVYPLTNAQKLHFYCLKYCPKKQVLNIGASLTIQVDLDREMLKKSIEEAISRCEAMRLRFAEDKEGNTWQYVVKQDDSFVEHFDFTGWTMEAAQKKMEEWTETPFPRFDLPGLARGPVSAEKPWKTAPANDNWYCSPRDLTTTALSLGPA